jgi:fucose 4-O-acetylase-like acetyltransferase
VVFSFKNQLTIFFKKKLKDKAKQYLIPYLTFLILTAIFSVLILENEINKNFLLKMVLGGKKLSSEFGVFWFITALFGTYTLYSVLKYYLHKKTFVLFIIFCYLFAIIESYAIHHLGINIFIPLNFDSSLYGLSFFYLGDNLKSVYSKFSNFVKSKNVISLIISVVTIFLIFYFYRFELDIKYQFYQLPVVNILIPSMLILSTLAITIVSNYIISYYSVLTTIGNYSLLIMYFHLPMKYLLDNYGVYHYTTYILLSLIIPIVFAKFIENNKNASLLFLGK